VVKYLVIIFGSVALLCGCEKNDIHKPDINPPLLSLNGNNPDTVILGYGWSDPGASASDDVGGNLTASITVTGVVNTALAGTYTVSYYVADDAGNYVQALRTVIVRNEAYRIEGEFNILSNCGGNENNIGSFGRITASSSFNKHIEFTGLPFNNTGHDITGYLDGKNLSISPFQAGNGATYVGDGSVLPSYNSLTLSVAFTPPTPGGSSGCTLLLSRR
jgi:hypothetical protein